MSTDDPSPAKKIARTFFRAGSTPEARGRAVRGWRVGAVGAAGAAVMVPVLFGLRLGTVPGFGWGVTVFFVAVCGLAAVGMYFLDRPEVHTPVPLRGDWVDRLGGFWLLACAFGPLLGWVLTALPAFTVDNWRWFYAGRVIVSVGLPRQQAGVTGLPLLRYAPVALALLVLSAWKVAWDLWAGPVGLTLAHTAQALRP